MNDKTEIESVLKFHFMSHKSISCFHKNAIEYAKSENYDIAKNVSKMWYKNNRLYGYNQLVFAPLEYMEFFQGNM
jgi:hypothetical protein